MSEQERSSERLYEVRGSFIYHTVTGEQLDSIAAAERLNKSLIGAGMWAARAGLAQGKLDKAESRISALEAELDDKRNGFPLEPELYEENLKLKAELEQLRAKAEWVDDFIRHLRICVELDGDAIDVIHTAVSAYERQFEAALTSPESVSGKETEEASDG